MINGRVHSGWSLVRRKLFFLTPNFFFSGTSRKELSHSKKQNSWSSTSKEVIVFYRHNSLDSSKPTFAAFLNTFVLKWNTVNLTLKNANTGYPGYRIGLWKGPSKRKIFLFWSHSVVDLRCIHTHMTSASMSIDIHKCGVTSYVAPEFLLPSKVYQFSAFNSSTHASANQV